MPTIFVMLLLYVIVVFPKVLPPNWVAPTFLVQSHVLRIWKETDKEIRSTIQQDVMHYTLFDWLCVSNQMQSLYSYRIQICIQMLSSNSSPPTYVSTQFSPTAREKNVYSMNSQMVLAFFLYVNRNNCAYVHHHIFYSHLRAVSKGHRRFFFTL